MTAPSLGARVANDTRLGPMLAIVWA